MTADATAAEQQQQQQEGSGVPPAAASSGTDPCWILVTGGCGYIGTHTIVLLLEQGCNVVVVDNLINSSEHSLDRVCQIVGLSEDDRSNRLVWHNVDLCDRPALQLVFEHSPRFEACIHFAGLKVRVWKYHHHHRLLLSTVNFSESKHSETTSENETTHACPVPSICIFCLVHDRPSEKAPASH